jgi:prolyl oligopeptidase
VPGHHPGDFMTQQVFYESKDGTKIPMFIISKKDMVQNGENGVYLYGYGGFSISLTPSFNVFRTTFIQSFNAILAIPNIRGGAEYGEDWHTQAIKEHRHICFEDFECAAEYLVAQKYTNPNKICINGGSNGGTLVSACANRRPDLFRCVVSQVPVADMLRFHKFTIGHAWCTDFGCSDNEKEFKALYAYSPLHNVRKGVQYPAILVTTADHDDRVVPLHSFKYAATLHHELGETNTLPLLIRIETKAGHGAGKPTTKIIEEYSDVYAFIAHILDLTWVEKSTQ